YYNPELIKSFGHDTNRWLLRCIGVGDNRDPFSCIIVEDSRSRARRTHLYFEPSAALTVHDFEWRHDARRSLHNGSGSARRRKAETDHKRADDRGAKHYRWEESTMLRLLLRGHCRQSDFQLCNSLPQVS